MAEAKYLFERVKRAAKKAIEAERNGDLKVAFDRFLHAAELLNQLIAVERTKRIRDSYYVKAKEYITRAKELKLLMDAPKDAGPPKPLPSPPKTQKPDKKDVPPPPPPKEEKKPPMPPPPKDDLPPPSEDMTKKMMRGEDTPSPPKDKPKPKDTPAPPPPAKPEPKEIDLPTKTTFELLFDEEKYRDCITECAKSVEAELRVRLGLFDEQLTLGMLIEKGIGKGMEVLKEFKFVNIILNRIEHENYRPSRADAHKAVDITNRILMS
ncbi:MAG: hypothetical protein FK732_02995 [Asgard group archaeon]|nr:hypothetical protein [Asgard group archaeon]